MVEIYRDKAGEWRFRVKGENGEIVAQGEGYSRKASAIRGVETLRRIMVGAVMPTINVTPPEKQPELFEAQDVHVDVVYEYKDRRYCVVRYSAAHLIQFEADWRPTIEYVLAEPQSNMDRDLYFYRADTDFASKFKRVP